MPKTSVQVAYRSSQCSLIPVRVLLFPGKMNLAVVLIVLFAFTELGIGLLKIYFDTKNIKCVYVTGSTGDNFVV